VILTLLSALLCCITLYTHVNNADVDVDAKDCPIPMQRVIIADCGELPDTAAATTNGKHTDNISSRKAVSRKSKKHDSSDDASDNSSDDSGSESSSTDSSAEVSLQCHFIQRRSVLAYSTSHDGAC
jgi:hypothetical protein